MAIDLISTPTQFLGEAGKLAIYFPLEKELEGLKMFRLLFRHPSKSAKTKKTAMKHFTRSGY